MTDFLPPEFKLIPGHSSYAINKDGVVLSLPKKTKWGKNKFRTKMRRLKHSNSKIGYLTVGLGNRNYYLHRLLAKTFLDNPHNYKLINHKDGNKKNNSLFNLEWCTSKYNVRHAWKNGLMRSQSRFGTTNPASKLDWGAVNRIRNLKGLETLQKTAKKFKISVSQVWMVQNKKSWTREGVVTNE